MTSQSHLSFAYLFSQLHDFGSHRQSLVGFFESFKANAPAEERGQQRGLIAHAPRCLNGFPTEFGPLLF